MMKSVVYSANSLYYPSASHDNEFNFGSKNNNSAS